MRVQSHHYLFCLALTLAVGCDDGTPIPVASTAGAAGNVTGGSSAGGGGAGGAGSSAGGSSAGVAAGGSATSGAGGSATGGLDAGGGGLGGGTAGGGAGGAIAGGGAGGMAGVGGAAVAVCGNGAKEDPEACDDGAKVAGDGCSDTCTLETGYVCPTPGLACTPLCGDGMLILPEKCDDKNALAGDGCSDTCTLEPGWVCATVGAACTSTCGDGILVGDELCDDKNQLPSDGCSATCTVEAGFLCDVPGERCHKKPDCPGGGTCTSTCGDGIVLGEACDDGNTDNGDGCSSACAVEGTHTCQTLPVMLPAQRAIPVIYRDFVSVPAGGSTKFPDQQAFGAGMVTLGMVGPTLGVDGLPVYTGVCEKGGPNELDLVKCPFGAQTSSKANFDQWYRDTADVNLRLPGAIRLDRVGQTDAYVFNGTALFTPLTGKGWDALGKEGLTLGQNFGFTTELRFSFVFNGEEQLDFSGDDDIWVFVNGKLAVDLGGVHPSQSGSVSLGPKATELGLTVGNLYEVSLFQAERQPVGSKFKLTLTKFVNKTSKCTKI